MRTDRLDELMRRVHKLKGAAVNIDAGELAGVAGFLELALRQGRKDVAATLIQPVCAALARVLEVAVLVPVCQEEGVRMGGTVSIDKRNLLHLAVELGMLLDKRDIRCDAHFDLIRKGLAGCSGFGEILAPLQAHLDRLEIQEARRSLDVLIRQLET